MKLSIIFMYEILVKDFSSRDNYDKQISILHTIGKLEIMMRMTDYTRRDF
jgi:hypothetical protein